MGGCLSIRIRENVMKCINVKCEGKPAYDIVIESGFGGLSEAFNKLEITGRKLCIVTDSNVGPLYAEQVKNELEKTGNAVAARQALISGHIRIWLEHSISQSLYI